MEQEARSEQTFINEWIWATLQGFFFGFALAAAIADLGSYLGFSWRYSAAITWTSFGICAGVAQLQVLKRYTTASAWWVGSIAIGLALPLGLFGRKVGALWVWSPPWILGGILVMGFTGALVGFLNLLLQGSALGRSVRWVFVNGAAWPLAYLCLVTFGGILSVGEDPGDPINQLLRLFIGVPLAGIALSGITGATLYSKLREKGLVEPPALSISAGKLGATVGRVFLGVLIYWISAFFAGAAMFSFYGRSGESAGIGLGYITFGFPTAWIILAGVVGIILRFGWRGVFLVPVPAALYAVISVFILEG